MGVTISRIEAKDFKRLKETVIWIKPGGRVEFSGPTGCGKTTLLELVVQGLTGIDPLDVRPGADKAEITIELTDRTEIKRTRTAKGTGLTVRRGPAGDRVDDGKGFVESLLGGAVLDPLALLDSARLKQAILEAIGVKVDPSRVAEALAVKVEELPNLDWAAPAPDVCARLRDHYAGRRTEAGREVKQKVAALAEATKRLPEPMPALTYSLADVEQDERAAQASAAAERAKVAAVEAANRRLSAVNQDRRGAANKITELEDEVARLRASLASLEEEAGKLRERIDGEGPDQVAIERAGRVLADAGQRRAQLRQHEANAVLCEAADGLRAEADLATHRHAALDAKVKAAGRVLTDLVASGSALPGLSWDAEHETFRMNDAPVEKLSSGEKIRLAVKLARLRAPALKLMLVDGVEKLDPDQLDALREEIQDDPEWVYWTTRTAAEAAVVGAAIEVRA